MKLQKIITLICALFVTVAVFGQKQLPNVSAKTLDGKTVNMQDYADGKLRVISFWATWCSPCKKELDTIADYYEEWQEDYDMELIAISIDTRRAVAKVPGIVSTKGWEYEVLTGDEQDMQNAFNFQTIPQTYLVDKNGNIVWSHNGYLPGDEEELEAKIAEYAKK